MLLLLDPACAAVATTLHPEEGTVKLCDGDVKLQLEKNNSAYDGDVKLCVMEQKNTSAYGAQWIQI